jgi:hypothetical protein
MVSVEIKKVNPHPRNPNPKVTEGKKKLTGKALGLAGKEAPPSLAASFLSI